MGQYSLKPEHLSGGQPLYSQWVSHQRQGSDLGQIASDSALTGLDGG
jgi:hypothetical protein